VVKQGPSFWRITAMVVFALSCFGILTFLWVSFGGSVPLKPRPYQLMVDFPEATTLAEQADVRISGVPVGKVQKKQLDGNYTLATLRIDPQYAPLPQDVKAILRQKTLLGETYVELTPGTRNGPKLPDGGKLAQGNIAQTVQLDEIFRAFDPKTRAAFRSWLDQQGRAFDKRGKDLNAALGNLTPFEQDATTLLQVLNQQKADTRKLVANTGVVFDALTERGDQLRSLIDNSNRVFATTASRNKQLQQIFTIFPTFLDEARVTTSRLTEFSRNANPLITQLRPAARELSPTLIDLKSLAPDLKGLFRDLGPLITVSKRGLPAVRRILDDTTPLLGQLEPFLRNLNPMLDYLGLYKREIVGFFANDAASTQSVDRPPGSNVPIHYLRTANPLNPENLAAYPARLSTNRSNPYVAPGGYSKLPLKVFGTYLCTTVPVPELVTPGTLPSLPFTLPGDLTDLLPDALRNGINQFALNSGTVPAPPCTEQAPLGQVVGQTGKYPQIKAAPPR
jgi:phospholipid/cholesterol/gamma-HCH transport system substrate-binding protein